MAVKPKAAPKTATSAAEPAPPGPFARRAGFYGLVLVLLLVAVNAWVARNGVYDGAAVARAWGLAAALIVLFMIMVGVAINNRPAGLIIDNRNRVSLSKLQAAAWTVLVVSAVATMAAARIAAGVSNPLEIVIPGELLAALGLSAASLAATPALLTLNSNRPPPTEDQRANVARTLEMADNEMDSTSSVFGRTDPAYARWMDIFRGEDVATAASPDLSKIQQFLLTLLVLGVYVAALLVMFLRQEATLILPPGGASASLPPISEEFIWLLGISHASYLAYKAAPQPPLPTRS
jgi:hypothetical protein